MRFLFISECSPLIGTGHVMRSITLANAVKQLGHEVIFHGNWLCQWGKNTLTERGFRVSSVALSKETSSSQLTIMDGYSFDLDLMHQVMSKSRLAVIEDYLHRQIKCDILIDPNIGGEASFFSDGAIEFSHYVGGSSYVTLTETVIEETPVPPRNKGRNLLVSFGGSDPGFASENVLQQLLRSPKIFDRLALVVGPMFDKERRLDLETKAASSSVEIVGPVSSLAPLYRDFRWSIGAGGTSAYERVFQMVPSLNLITQSNQERLAGKLSELGLAVSLDVREGDYSGIIDALASITEASIEKELEDFRVQLKGGSGAYNLAKKLEAYISA